MITLDLRINEGGDNCPDMPELTALDVSTGSQVIGYGKTPAWQYHDFRRRSRKPQRRRAAGNQLALTLTSTPKKQRTYRQQKGYRVNQIRQLLKTCVAM